MRTIILMVCAVFVIASNAQGLTSQARYDLDVVNDTVILNDSTASFTAAVVKKDTTIKIEHRFNPDPMRAMWLSALCPGLGQIYNRRYWKLPIVIGAFVGLTYGTTWNNRMLNDYSKAYRDISDNDPNTRSYMDFYPPTVQESDLDKTWLTNTLKNRKDYYRRYRDICIIGMAAVYLLNVIDAYVDASMMHFDVTPDLSMQWGPTVIDSNVSPLPSIGLGCALSF
ncbi:MAG: hypothetical protein IJR20_06805 [Muribaculaceae bacterium]|nr:hypothetical protein [Muribaculaceae bacterium]